MEQKEFVLVSQSDISELLRRNEYLYGVQALQNELNISRASAIKLTKEKLNGCYFRSGKRKIVYERDKVLAVLKSETKTIN